MQFSTSTTTISTPLESRPRNHNRSRSSDGLIPAKFIPEHSPTADQESHYRSTVQKSSDAIASNKKRITRLFSLTPTSSLESTTSFSFADDPPLVPIPNYTTNHRKSASDAPISELEHSGRRTAMIRKKSGELVRSSLKSGDLTPLEGPASSHSYSGRRSPRSAPSTPSSKYVHFDTQLEHVKLFLAQQKPAAVSRQGSPTLETETEDEAFPFPAMTTAQPGLLSLRLPNFPKKVDVDQDAFLESLEIATDGKSLRGIVRVKNLAFSKHVAIRFTLDNWMTVSEVSCDYLQAHSATIDRFVFGIKLQDLLARIEEKVMFIAVRYTVDGREIWDNNGGGNYRVEFKKERIIPTPPPVITRATTVVPSRKSTWSAQTQAQELSKELESLVKEEVRESRNESKNYTEGSPTYTAFSTRYDFGTSFKSTSSGRNGRAASPPKASSLPLTRNSPVTGGRGLPTEFGSAYSTMQSGSTQLYSPTVPEVIDNFSSSTHDYSKSNPNPTTNPSRYNTYPNPISSEVTPLPPPIFRGKRSPFGSPANSSPNGSPPQSPSTSISSLLSETLYVHSSPDSEPMIPDTKATDFSNFLDRYCFHQSTQPSTLGIPIIPQNDFNSMNNNYYGSTNSSGTSTPITQKSTLRQALA